MAEKLQWYPGHMTKAFRQMKEDIKLVDIFIEICDARIPESSRNPEIDSLVGNKQRVLLFNKADLADRDQTTAWIEYYREKGFYCASIDARDKKSMRIVDRVVDEASAKKRERDAKRGIKNRPVRAMVGGIPNGGKSTFINTYAGRSSAKTGNKPGVTKGKQWIRMKRGVELLDTPGVLWPKFEDERTGAHLAYVGSIREEIYEIENLALDLMKLLVSLYPQVFVNAYGINVTDSNEIIRELASIRGCIRSGGELDLARAAKLLVDDYRSGRLGGMTLEQL